MPFKTYTSSFARAPTENIRHFWGPIWEQTELPKQKYVVCWLGMGSDWKSGLNIFPIGKLHKTTGIVIAFCRGVIFCSNCVMFGVQSRRKHIFLHPPFILRAFWIYDEPRGVFAIDEGKIKTKHNLLARQWRARLELARCTMVTEPCLAGQNYEV